MLGYEHWRETNRLPVLGAVEQQAPAYVQQAGQQAADQQVPAVPEVPVYEAISLDPQPAYEAISLDPQPVERSDGDQIYEVIPPGQEEGHHWALEDYDNVYSGEVPERTTAELEATDQSGYTVNVRFQTHLA